MKIKSMINLCFYFYFWMCFFFQDFLDGSKPHNELMEKAREFYVNSVGVEGEAKKPVILRLMQSVFADIEKFKKAESHLPADDGKLLYL